MTIDENEIIFPDTTDFAAVTSLVGLLSLTILLIVSVLLPREVVGIDSVKPVENYVELALSYSSQIILLVILDTIFVVGYMSLFIGLFLVIRDIADTHANIALYLGITTGILDLVENALIIGTTKGISGGWQPNDQIIGLIFILDMLVNLLSYGASLLFAIAFILIFRDSLRLVVGSLLAVYPVIGLGSLLYQPLLLVRSFVFIVGLGLGSYMLWREKDISNEMLKDLFGPRKSTDDFVR